MKDVIGKRLLQWAGFVSPVTPALTFPPVFCGGNLEAERTGGLGLEGLRNGYGGRRRGGGRGGRAWSRRGLSYVRHDGGFAREVEAAQLRGGVGAAES